VSDIAQFFLKKFCPYAEMNINLQYQHKYLVNDYNFFILVVAQLEIQIIASRLTIMESVEVTLKQ
jgi:hypothetical protein